MKITKEQFDKLYDKNILKSEYDYIIDLIDDRFAEICKIICPKHDRQWFDYGNCSYEGEDSNGYFDIKEYKEYIKIGGEYSCIREPYCTKYENAFPTRWLWEDFEEEFLKEVRKFEEETLKRKEQIKEKREKKKQEKIEFAKTKPKFQLIIKSKLTAEELKYIKFK
jgi:hypothetical protein